MTFHGMLSYQAVLVVFFLYGCIAFFINVQIFPVVTNTYFT